jgi:redox-sensitive bicupin YhaK (pirin superfamily)
MPQNYRLKNKANGLYLFVIEGGARVNQEVLSKRDALGIWDVSEIEIHPAKNSQILLMELPMKNQ